MLRRSKNIIDIVGYVKENTLEYADNAQNAIKGHVTLIISAGQEYKVQFYSNRMTKAQANKPSTPTKLFAELEQFLGTKTTSLEEVMKIDPSLTFETAKDKLSKIRCLGSMQEFLRYDKESNFDPTVTYRGMRCMAVADEAFEPKANFSIEVYIESMKHEMDKENAEETGRIEVVGLAPDYFNGVTRIPFVATTDDIGGGETPAAYVEQNYKVGDTVLLTGNLVNMTIKRQDGVRIVNKGFTEVQEPRIITEFVNERQILGGSPEPMSADDPKEDRRAFPLKDIKDAMAVREQKIDEAAANAMDTGVKVGFGASKKTNTGFATATNKPKIEF